jgi:catechol 2,3-dioxygenase-like lactoylglutathione lyase family enzyme
VDYKALKFFFFEIEVEDYEKAKELLLENNIQVKKEIVCKNDFKSRPIYFRDPAGNLFEFVTRKYWGVQNMSEDFVLITF